MSFYFSKDDILHIHSKLIDDFGGSDGIRDEGMLDSAINTPLQTFDSTDPYPTDPDKIARLSFGLVMDHPFPKERGCGKPSRPLEEKKKDTTSSWWTRHIIRLPTESPRAISRLSWPMTELDSRIMRTPPSSTGSRNRQST